MTKIAKTFVPAFPYEAGPAHGILSAFEPGSRILPKGFQLAPQFRPLTCDILFEKDVPVRLRDGVTIYTDIFRPLGATTVPAIIAWSPYGKSGGSAPKTTGLYATLGIDNGLLSGLAKFEGPDPAWWVAQGYAICNPDPRGIARSEGDAVLFGRQEGQDCHDLIEWLAEQDWCSGKVAMSGTSYLAIAQWFTAAEQPPHLAAINPVEGVSDAYRDLCKRGGMPDPHFTRRLQINHVGAGLREEVAEAVAMTPFADAALWTDKAVALERVQVPAYVVASYSNTLHTMGTFRAWRRIGSADKWLRIHNNQEWPDYYEAANVADLTRFFDHFLKGIDNGWKTTPRVRYAVHDMKGGDRINVAADSFPPAGSVLMRYYLDARTRTLGLAPGTPAEAVYDTASEAPMASFVHRFDRDTTLVGYPKAALWVEARGHDDMDLFVLAQKLDAQGSVLTQFTVPAQGALMQDLTENGASVLRYKGSNGRLRVSARALDATSTEEVPVHSFDRVEKLSPGQVVEVQIDMFPLGLSFAPGDQLRLVVGSRNTLGSMMPGTPAFAPENQGLHVIHTGGDRASYLQLPVMG
jgi:predicted acyl esterase